MSVSQVNFRILPRSEIISIHGEVPKTIEVLRVAFGVPTDELDQRRETMPVYWNHSIDWSSVENEFAKLLPEIDSWSDVARMFGDNDGDSVQIWKRENIDGPLERLTVAFSLAKPNIDFIKSALTTAEKCDCVLHSIESMAVFSPLRGHFVHEAMKLRASWFIPKDYDLATALA